MADAVLTRTTTGQLPSPASAQGFGVEIVSLPTDPIEVCERLDAVSRG